MIRILQQTLHVFIKAGERLLNHQGVEIAGYLTFLELLSLFPFVVIITAIAGALGQGEEGKKFIEMALNYMPQDAVAAAKPRIHEIISGPPQGLLTIALCGALWTSSSALEGFRTVLNQAYDVTNPPRYWLRRILSLLQILLISGVMLMLMLTLIVLPVGLSLIKNQTGWNMPEELFLFLSRDILYLACVLMVAIVALIYYWLPNKKQSMLAVLPGAVLVVSGWVAGAKLVSFYLNNISEMNLIYGSLSGLIAAMIFFFVMNLIFIYGAEFNHVLLSARTNQKK